MKEHFFNDIDLNCNVISNAGFEVVDALPATNLFIGRKIIYNNTQYCYLDGMWRIIPDTIITNEEIDALF